MQTSVYNIIRIAAIPIPVRIRTTAHEEAACAVETGYLNMCKATVQQLYSLRMNTFICISLLQLELR